MTDSQRRCNECGGACPEVSEICADCICGDTDDAKTVLMDFGGDGDGE